VNDGGRDLRLIDFGTSCRIGQKQFEYVHSRFYRAPEIFFGIGYGVAVDMWSFGCLMSELATGRALFAGQSELQQIKLYIQAIGPPKASLLARAKRKSAFFWPDGRVMGEELPGSSVREVTGIADDDLIELIEACLDWEQQTRITASQALKLPYFTGKRNPDRSAGSRRVAAVSETRTLSPRRLARTRPVNV
jgi:dual specificity tyrosine-phosphorylation-regulated kinase 2/3/4